MKKLLIPILFVSLFIASCGKDDDPTEQLVNGPDVITYGITANNELVSFNAKAPSISINKKSLTGIGSGEKIISIDFRPATGELYGLSDGSKLYIISQKDATTRPVSGTAFTPGITAGVVTNIDFNPTVDRIRLVAKNGQNLRLHPETGAVAATDGNISGITSPTVSAIGYTNSKAGASATILYDIDETTAKLYKQDPPNNGTLVEVGALGITPVGNIAFDITSNNVALAIINSALYDVNLNTGAASKIGNVTDAIIDIAVPTEAVAYAVDMNNNLVIFNPTNITAGTVSKPITGTQSGETILGIDFRPATGQLFAVGSTNKIYTINLSSGAAAAVGTVGLAGITLGSEVGFDFNPTVDRIRLVSDNGINLRLNPNDGTVAAADLILNPGNPDVTSAAYTNNFAGTTATQLFVIDHLTDKLYLQNPPNNGVLAEIGNLGINIENNNGFDIGSRSNQAWLLATVGSSTQLYSVNTATGVASNGTTFPMAIRSFSVGLGF